MEKEPKMQPEIIPFEQKLLKKKLGLPLNSTENDVQKAIEKKAEKWASGFVKENLESSSNDTDEEKI